MKNKILTTFIAIASAGCSVFGISSVEEPSYEVIKTDGSFEIRKYESYLVAKTTVDGSFNEAQSSGFKILADFIFGNNQAQSKIAMTAPVVQQPKAESENIAMTAPVMMAPEDQDFKSKRWTMTFTMPKEYTTQTLPKPNNPKIEIERVEGRFLAINKFSGFWSQSKNQKKSDELQSWIKQQNDYEADSAPKFAGYNPPWTLPFLRRNEVAIELRTTSL